MLEVFNDVTESHVGTHDAPEETKQEDEDVSDASPMEPSKVSPICGCVDQGRGHDAQSGHFDGAEESHHQLQPRNSGGQGDCKEKTSKVTAGRC